LIGLKYFKLQLKSKKMKTQKKAIDSLKSFQISSIELVKGGEWVVSGSNSGPGGTTYDWMEINNSTGMPTGNHQCYVPDNSAPMMN
jgi:hypothetical protein